MDANNQMQMNFASQQLARVAEPPTSVNKENPVAWMKFETPEDHLTQFMTRAMTLETPATPKVGSFVNCTTRFNGAVNRQIMDNLILNITLYKDAEGISDEVALRELPLLLEGAAATWWAQIKENVNDWATAVRMLKEAFIQRRPAYEIYAEVFSGKQDEYISTEMFIRQKLALLAELPQPHPEEVQMDMIYSLLKQKIQKKVPRNSVFTMGQLIEAANNIEQKKKDRRMKKYINFECGAMKPVLKTKEKCSHCRKSRKSAMETGDMDCYKCNSQKYKRGKHLKAETVNPVYAPLQGFNSNVNPFNKSFMEIRDSKKARQRKL